MSIPATAVAGYQPVLSDVERMTTLGFLAADRRYTRDAYALVMVGFSSDSLAAVGVVAGWA